jgi:SecD/SecF fusion protein
MKKVLAALLALLIIVGWVISLTDFGPALKNHLKLGLDLKGGVYVVMEAQTDKSGKELADMMVQTQAVIQNRVNQMGLSEPSVLIEGEKKIRVELPGAENSQEAIANIGRTAQLKFALGDGTVALDGSQVKNAQIGQDAQGFPAVDLEFTSEGAKAFEEATRMALSQTVINPQTQQPDNRIYIILDNQVQSDPAVKEVIAGGKAQITGNFTDKEVADLSILIRAGALPVDMKEVQTSIVGPTLGIDSLRSSVVAGVIGIGLILLLMLVMYWLMGLIANIALSLYIMVVFWILALFSAVLNLPGIAGIILSIGMAVDSNVIIFARIKEEYQNGKSLRVAVDSGFKRALSTVIDSQLTTLIAGVVLYQFGTGPVRGFAMTLMIGIVVSVLTAVIVTQFLLKTVLTSKILGTAKLFGVEFKRFSFKKEFSFIKYRRYFYIISVAIIVIGLGVGFVRGFNYGIDFTGGTMLHLDIGKTVAVAEAEEILKANEIEATVVHAGDTNQQLIIRTTQALDNVQREAVLKSFFDKYGLSESNVIAVEQFSPSVGDLFKRNAFKAVIIAALCMLIYIIVRFEWKFGIGAIASLAHDVLIMIAFYAIFQIPINNPFIAGILIIVGYSINDTIVIFDRIRENLKLMRKSKLEELIDKSINQTLVRSLMTSVTTILAIVPLFVLGGTTIREFTLPLLVGIAAGAISSITIASPIYYNLSLAFDKTRSRSKYQRRA